MNTAGALRVGLGIALLLAVALGSLVALSPASLEMSQHPSDVLPGSQQRTLDVVSPVSATSASLGSAETAEVLVKFADGADVTATAEMHQRNGGTVVGTIPEIGVHVVEVPGEGIAESLASYAGDPLVEYAELNGRVQSAGIASPGVPNDTYFYRQWNMEMIQAPQAWEISRGSPEVVIAILDSGIDGKHPDLSSKIVASRNFTCSATAEGVLSHGTHVAGTAAAITNNNKGVAGVGYNCSLMNVKVIDDTLGGCYSWLIQGILWATDHGANVINMNLIAGVASSSLEYAVNYAWERGVVLIAPAGNGSSSSPTYPGSYANCIAVSATNATDTRCSWSNYGAWVNVAAPGIGIYSTICGGYYGMREGTCASTPHVAGLAGLLFAVTTDRNGNGRVNDEVRHIIENTCDDIGDSTVGYGRINAYRALLAATGSADSTSQGSISGTVTDAVTGGPIADAVVSAGTKSTLSSADGSYSITDVPEGSYTVTVSATGYEDASQGPVSVAAGSVSQANLSLIPLLPTADFQSDVRQGNEPLMVPFEDESASYCGVVSWLWSFGDGQTSAQQNPVHAYTQDGTYTVSLTVTEADGDRATITRAGHIVVFDTGPEADFSSSLVAGDPPLGVAFSDRSTSYDGICSWQWRFGDGTGSGDRNPVHTYSEPGQYTVVLEVTEPDGSTGSTARVVDVGATCTTVSVTVGEKPLMGWRVYVYTADGAYAGHTAYTDGAGQASFELPGGSYRFKVYYEGVCWDTDVITAPGNATIDIPAETVVTVMAAGGEPLVGHRVYAYTDGGAYVGRTANTDALGMASFVLPEGTYKFRVCYGGAYWYSQTVSAAGHATIDIPAETVVTVTVGDQPLVGYRVYAYTADGVYAGYAVYTDASGQASFCLPEGSYTFRVYYDGCLWQSQAVAAPGRVDLDIS